MNKHISAFFCGILFAIGLAISGMTTPSKVMDFLNILEIWDPTLLFVLGGATGSYIIFSKFILKRSQPIFEAGFNMPVSKQIDIKLVSGATIFGLGWGFAGVCPGPALASLAVGSDYILVFTVAMIIGVYFANFLSRSK